MKVIKKGKEPNQLSLHRNSGGTWDDFSSEKGKEAVKEQLLLEQGDLCAYCTCKINFENMKVEHWCSRSLCPENRNLDYSNLLAVCKGNYRSGLHFHCDTSKGSALINLDPQNIGHVNIISYTKGTGKILSSNLTHQHEIDSILKLNIPSLKKARKAVLDNLRIQLRVKYKGKKANYQKELNKWRHTHKAFGMVAIQYLEKKLAV